MLSFKIIVCILTGAAVLGRLCLPMIKRWQKHEEAWDKRFTFVAVAVASAAAIWAINDTSQNVRDNTEQARIAASFNFMQRLDDRGIVKFADYRLEAMRSNLDVNAFNKKLVSDPKMVQTVDSLLGNFEDMSVAIKSRYLDERVLYYELRNITLWSSTNLAIHVREVRQLRGTNYLDEFDDLVEAWGSRKSLADGHAFKETKYDP